MAMNSIPTKIKVTTLIGLATLIGIVVYVKADRTTLDDSLDNAYNVKTIATTNLNAVMKTQARTNEFTSAEYANKMAPQAAEVSAYLALYEDFSHQDNTGGYARRTAPQTHPVAVKDKRQKSASKTASQSYEAYGVSTVVKSDSLETISEEEEEFEQPEDPRLQIETNVKQRVLGVDGYANYSKDYSRVVKNAENNDDAYQVKETPSAYEAYKGYAVISANRGSEAYSDGYAKRRAPENGGTNTTPVRDRTQSKPFNETYEGYARVQAGSHNNNIAQYDNAKSNDKAYQAYGSSTTTNVNASKRVAYGEYPTPQTNSKASASTDMAMTTDGYAKRRAPQGGTNATPVKDMSNTRSDETYGGYAVRTPGKAKSKAASSYQQYAQTNNDTYAGYAVRTPKTKGSTSSTSLANAEAGYARRRAPEVAGGASTNLAQYENASKNDYAYKSAPSTSSEESYGGYAVRTPGKKKAKSADASREYAQYGNKNTYGGQSIQGYGEYPTKTAQQTTRISRARGGVPASTGLKMYGNRGERLAVTTSQMDRTVIVMPKRGRSVKGTVIQDDPGKNIIVQSSTGVQSTYKYGEIDAVVNI